MINGTPHQNGHGRTDLMHPPPPSVGQHQLMTEQSPLALVDDRMRGRWKYAIPLGVVLGVAFAVVAYKQAPVTYVSMGNIHVVPSGSHIMHQTPESGTVPRYEGVVTTQAMFVRTPRVIERALQKDEELRAIPLASHPEAREIIAANLNANAARGAELIVVTYEADSPQVAQTVLNAVLRSYDAIHGNNVTEARIRRLEQLRDIERTKRADLNRRKQEQLEFTARARAGAVVTIEAIQAKLLSRDNFGTQLANRELELKMALAESGQADLDQDSDGALRAPTTDELDAIDPNLASARAQLDLLKLEHQRWKERILKPDHAILQNYQRQLDAQYALVAQKEELAREKWLRLKGQGAAGSPILAASGQSISEIESQVRLLKAVVENIDVDLRKMTEENRQYQQIQHEIDKLTAELTGVERELEIAQIESEAIVAGSISIAEWGSRPLRPAKDKRMQMAGVAFAGGIGLSLAVFFLLSSIDQRTFSATQLQRSKHRYRCLGVLPDLGIGRLERDMSETAVHCIHQIRNRIEALRHPLPSFMLVISSPYQGDGKTSLAMSLGWSYAAAGYRTLLMDCDIVGRGLSHHLGLSRNEGLREILRKRRLESQIVSLPIPNLSALPVGIDRSIGPESIRRDDFATMCGELREMFDIIIVDTGPYIGSIEMLPVASAADGVVFSIRRGRSRGRLDECVSDVSAAGIPCLGVVLNCAVQSDCVRYVSKSLTSRASTIITPNPDVAPDNASRNHPVLVRALEQMNREQQEHQESAQ